MEVPTLYICIYIKLYIYTHVHTHIYVCIDIFPTNSNSFWSATGGNRMITLMIWCLCERWVCLFVCVIVYVSVCLLGIPMSDYQIQHLHYVMYKYLALSSKNQLGLPPFRSPLPQAAQSSVPLGLYVYYSIHRFWERCWSIQIQATCTMTGLMFIQSSCFKIVCILCRVWSTEYMKTDMLLEHSRNNACTWANFLYRKFNTWTRLSL